MSRILVVDDEQSIGWGLSEYFRDLNHEVRVLGSVEEAMQSAQRFLPDTILLDVRLPGQDGLSAIEGFRRQWGPIPIVVMTAFGDLATAVQAMKQGAFEYLTKPFDLEEAGNAVSRALGSIQAAISDLSGSVTELAGDEYLLGKSTAMQNVFKSIALVAPTNVPVLITGETGTGKELAAQAIHRYGLQAKGPFVPINLAALNSNLVESELFGHVRGAFTGAVDDRPGLIDLANDGTLLLDEIAEASLEVQVKLLRFLETRQFAPVGSGQLKTANVRVIAATRYHLAERCASGEFREDLLFRLRGFEFRMPALRERPSDIPQLAEYFLRQACPNRPRISFSPEFSEVLQKREWLGNVRELRSAIEQVAILSRGGTILPEHLPEAKIGTSLPPRSAADVRASVDAWIRMKIAGEDSGSPQMELYREFLGLAEPILLSSVLEVFHGNRAAAARCLGLDRTTLRTKLRLYGLDHEF